MLGDRHGWGEATPFGLGNTDRRRHLYVIGQTGAGKTTLLRNLIVQHLAAGHGVGLIDPHGDLAEELLRHIPPARSNHLCYFNPGDFDFPIGLNPLADVPPDERHLAASGIVSAFKNLWPDSWGPRLEYILYNAVAALLEVPDSTLLAVNRLLTDDPFRHRVCRRLRDPFLREFWTKEYASYDPRFRREAIAPIQNKLGQFLQSPAVRNILGQVRNRVSFPFLMDHQRIFIANLSKGRLGPDKANLLGSLLVTQFQLAAMARVNQPEESRRDFYLFVDEFQNFATEAFTSILAEARKYRLCLTLSHQYIAQLSPPVRQAVFGNVGSLVAFRVGHDDAEVLQGQFGNVVPASQLVELSRFEVFAKLLAEGEPLTPFRGVTHPPLINAVGRPDRLTAQSRGRYSAPRAIVEDKLHRWIRPNAGDGDKMAG